MDDTADPNLYSSTTPLLPNEERTLASQLAQSMGLISDWQLIRYHPNIGCSLAMCIIVILIQIAFVVVGYFLPEFLHPAKWLAFTWSMMAVATFITALVAYFVHHYFMRALKARGYLLIRKRFQTYRRIPFFVAALYVLVNMSGFSALVLLCPNAIQDPVNSTCKTPLLDKPYWLLYYAGLVADAGLLIICHLLLCIQLVRFHRLALRGRVLPDVLSELAQLCTSTGLGEASERPGPGDAVMAAREGGPASRGPEATINANNDVTETYARIVDIVDHSNVNETLSRVVMERQADVMFYMHQQIVCLQEELGRRQPLA